MTETDLIENGCEHEQKAGLLAGVLTGWGVPGGIARILAGAIIGALAAIVAMSQIGGVGDKLPPEPECETSSK